MVTSPEIALVCADTEIIDEYGVIDQIAPCRRPITLANFLCRSSIIHQGSTFFQLDAARSVGGWDGRYFCCDAEMWMKILFRYKALRVNRIWSAWRKHDNQRNNEAIKMWNGWQTMIQESDDIANAPLHLKLAAKAGRSVLAIDYNPIGRVRFRFYCAWRALLTYPPSYHAINPKSALMIFRFKNLIKKLKLIN